MRDATIQTKLPGGNSCFLTQTDAVQYVSKVTTRLATRRSADFSPLQRDIAFGVRELQDMIEPKRNKFRAPASNIPASTGSFRRSSPFRNVDPQRSRRREEADSSKTQSSFSASLPRRLFCERAFGSLSDEARIVLLDSDSHDDPIFISA